MGLPKRQHSKSRTRNRRAHWKIIPPTLVVCPAPNCGQFKPSHMACPKCGTYNGRQVIEVEQRRER